MARTDSTKVGNVIGLADNADLTQMLIVATTMIDRVSSMAIEDGFSLSALELENIETYLTAHLYALKDPQYQSKKTGKASATFQGQTAMGLDSTMWGQTAKMLDVSGNLAKLEKGVFVGSIAWMGTVSDDDDSLTNNP